MHDLAARLKETGFSLLPDFSGEITRFSRNGSKNSGWAYGKTIGEISVFRWGDFRTDESHEWVSQDVEANAEFKKEWEIAKEKERVEREAGWLLSARDAQIEFEKGLPYGEHPYLIEKGISGDGLFGARMSVDGRWLYVPLRGFAGNFWSMQKIGPRGEKQFYEGGKVRGLSHCIEGEDLSKVFICEGFATGVSIFQALEGKYSVICAMNCGNVETIASELDKEKYSEVIFCADNDQWTEGNPGVASAQIGAGILGRGKIVVPHFKNLEGKPTDFNDLAQREGLARVKEILLGETQVEPVVKPRNKKMSENTVIENVLSHFDGELICCHKDFYQFQGTHWARLNDPEVNEIKNLINKIAGHSYEYRNIESAFKHLMLKIEVPVERLHNPNPYVANFKNGTLKVIESSSGLTTNFYEHQKSDLLTNVIPIDYAENAKTNDMFMDMLSRVFNDDRDKDEKIKAISEMFGAALFPIYPHLWLLHGPAGSGKSTLMLLIYLLLGKGNICSVEPHEFQGFLMESMIGKLVNLVTDIDTSKVISDANLKKIEDRVLFRIDRKFKLPIYAPLPAVHIFGANELPRTFSGASKAHERRWTFIELSKYRAQPGLYQKDFVSQVWRSGPEGILNFALLGIKEVLKNGGHYVVPKSGAETMEKWQKELDPISLFLDDLDEPPTQKELGISKSETGRVERQKVWEAFKKWSDNSALSGRRYGKFAFYDAMRRTKFSDKKIDGVRYFAGFQIDGAGGQSF